MSGNGQRHPPGRAVSARNMIAFACIGIPALVELGLGVAYVTATAVMPYHQQALGVDWSQLDPRMRALLLTFINGYGSAHLAVGVALMSLLCFPLRRGQAWARWTILAVGFPVLAGTAYLSARLATATGAAVPWLGAVILLVLFMLGVALADPKAAASPGADR